MAASEPSSRSNLLDSADLEMGGPQSPDARTAADARPTLGRSLGMLGALFATAALVSLALATPPAEAPGVHYGQVTPADGEVARHDPQMTGAEGEAGVHYMLRGGSQGEQAPARAKMLPGYREATEVTQVEDLTFSKWLVQIGDLVHVGDPLFEASKAGHNVVITASSSGQIKELADAEHGKVLSKGSQLVIIGHPPPQLTPPMLFQGFAIAAILCVIAALAACLHDQPAVKYSAVEAPSQAPQDENPTHRPASVTTASRIERTMLRAAEPPAMPAMPALMADIVSAAALALERQQESRSTEVLLPAKDAKEESSAPSLPRLSRAALSAAGQAPAEDSME